jgi:hypothetical protein
MYNFVWDFTQNQVDDQYFLRDMESSAIHASDILVRIPGYPTNWNHTNFVSIGLANDENVLNMTKILELNKTDYESLKINLGISAYDFYLDVIDLDSNLIFEYGIYPTDSSKIIPVKRYCLLDNMSERKIVYLNLVVWK